MKSPKVSILIPVYNRKNYIADCIQSALEQTFTDFEIVIVDNASDDGTWEICQKYAAEDERVRIFRNESNIGPVRNWKICLDRARGQFSKFLFSDDQIEPDFIQEAINVFESNVAFVMTSVKYGENYDSAKLVDFISCNKPHNKISTEQYFSWLAEDKMPYSPGCAMFRTKDLKENLLLSIPSKVKHDYLKNGAGPDILIYALSANKYKYVTITRKTSAFFRVHDESFTVENKNNEVMNGYINALAWFFVKTKRRELLLSYLARKWAAIPNRQLSDIKNLIVKHGGEGGIINLGLFAYYVVRRYFKGA